MRIQTNDDNIINVNTNKKITFDLDSFIEYLKDVCISDPEAFYKIFIDNRVECNERLGNHPTVLVNCDGVTNKYSVSILGVLNGYFCHIQKIDENSSNEEFDKTERIMFDIDNQKRIINKILNSKNYKDVK